MMRALRGAVLSVTSAMKGYSGRMPKEITGLEFVKEEAHKYWWDWFDSKRSHHVVKTWVEKTRLTVRLWLAEWLMLKLEAYDFAGRRERLKVQQQHAALRAARIDIPKFDQAIYRSLGVLTKLQK